MATKKFKVEITVKHTSLTSATVVVEARNASFARGAAELLFTTDQSKFEISDAMPKEITRVVSSKVIG